MVRVSEGCEWEWCEEVFRLDLIMGKKGNTGNGGYGVGL